MKNILIALLIIFAIFFTNNSQFITMITDLFVFIFNLARKILELFLN